MAASSPGRIVPGPGAWAPGRQCSCTSGDPRITHELLTGIQPGDLPRATGTPLQPAALGESARLTVDALEVLETALIPVLREMVLDRHGDDVVIFNADTVFTAHGQWIALGDNPDAIAHLIDIHSFLGGDAAQRQPPRLSRPRHAIVAPKEIDEGVPCLHQLSSRLNKGGTTSRAPNFSDQTVDRGDLPLQRRDQVERAAGADDAGDRALPSDLTDEVVDTIRHPLHVNVSTFGDLLSGLSERAGDVGDGLQEVRKKVERAGPLIASLSPVPLAVLQIHVA
ncbi:hypothetical protein ACGFYT_11260 [Streptomyces sp. NPDC048208]|uniref:hypothetical protein n=1 Tax=Streptomyces sp. NPDC048208 TaxID=3365515 RepID=UPI003719436A